MNVLKDFVVLSSSEGKEKKTDSGIIIAVVAQEIDDSTIEKVAHVGPDVKTVKPGDKVLFQRHLFQEYTVEGKNYLIGKEVGLIAVL